MALGPKPRDYSQRTPKKMIRLALRSALSDRAADGKVIVIDEWQFEAPRTKDAKAALEALGIEGRALVVLGPDDVDAAKSFRNLPEVQIIEARELNAYDVLVNDYVVFTKTTVPSAAAPEPRARANDHGYRPAESPEVRSGRRADDHRSRRTA